MAFRYVQAGLCGGWLDDTFVERMTPSIIPKRSMYGLFRYIGVVEKGAKGVNVGIYSCPMERLVFPSWLLYSFEQILGAVKATKSRTS